MHARIARKASTLALTLLTLCPLLFGAQASPRQKKLPARNGSAAAPRTVVFAVSKYDSNATMEPVVVYARGAFEKPPVDGDEATVKTFVGDYYKPGRRYRLLSGGGESGSVTVKQFQGEGCVGLVAEVSLSTSARLGGNVKALATSSPTLGERQPSRRAPTEVERMSALIQAREAYAERGVGATLAKKMEVVNLTATDLDGDGVFELVGSFRVETKTSKGQDFNTLFMITEPVSGSNELTGPTGKPALVWFHHGAEADYADRHYVDQLDIDGDGTAEVVAAGTYYESNDYVIYAKSRGAWREVYKGGGGGC